MNGYNTEQFLSKIKAPVICKGAGEDISFENGETAAAYQFDKRYCVDSIYIEDGKAIVNLKEIPVPSVNWAGNEEVSFF